MRCLGALTVAATLLAVVPAGAEPPRLETEAALAKALTEEAERLGRNAKWSKQMATELRRGAGIWKQAIRGKGKRARWVFDDLIAAWDERTALFEAAAQRYRTQALSPRTDAMVGTLPAPTMPADPAPPFKEEGADGVASGIRQKLRTLLYLEHKGLVRLLALTRGDASARMPPPEAFERFRPLRGDAFSTAIVANLFPKRVVEIDTLRSNLLTDADLRGFFDRAPRIIEALRRLGGSKVQIEAREVGPLKFADAIRGRDGGYSTLFRGRSVWTFGDTVLQKAGVDGERWRSSTWCETTDRDARDGLAPITEPLDLHGAPREFLPFTDDELAFNKEHNREELGKRRRRWALWPGPIVVNPRTGEALVFYGKLKCGAGQWDFKLVGHSLAKWTKPDAPIARPVVDSRAQEPTLLFGADDPLLGQGAFVDNGWIYAYGVKTQQLAWPCILARVRFELAFRKDAWEYWGQDGWTGDAKAAVRIMEAAPQMSVHWNGFLKRYVAFYSNPLRNSIAMRTAPKPQGPWSKERFVHNGEPPVGEDRWNYCGIAHAELQREGGKVEYVTYYRTTGFLQGEIRLVEVRFR